MAIYNIPIGVPTGFYVGDNTGSQAPLKKIFCQRTGGIRIKDNVPRNYIPSKDTQLQAGLHIVTLDVAFLGEDQFVTKMSKGIPILGSTMNDAPGNTVYSIFLLNPVKTQAKSFWFPELQIVSASELNYQKTDATVMRLTFAGTNRSMAYPLVYRDTWVNFTNSSLYPSFQERNPINFSLS